MPGLETLCSFIMAFEVLRWYLNQYDIPATPEHITDLREGVDYLIEDGQ